jgi:hypothetical protein
MSVINNEGGFSMGGGKTEEKPQEIGWKQKLTFFPINPNFSQIMTGYGDHGKP